MKRKSVLILVIVLIGLFSFTGLSHSSGKDEAKALVKRAAAYLKYQGKGKALAEISKPRGTFDKGEMYVFAYDLQGVMLAHPKNPELIGKNLIDIPDSEGKLFRREIVEKAKKKGFGWVDYLYLNPETKEMEHKTTYLLRVDDIILCCGAYREYSHEGD
ncbi:MAG: cache type 2 domain-containing protein [Desulfuromonadales bacterium]|nr:MAG: cache type 2 domain-containing protein [Desulfuromonadales bacterium]